MVSLTPGASTPRRCGAYHARAALTASSTSSSPPLAQTERTVSVAGLRTSKVAPSLSWLRRRTCHIRPLGKMVQLAVQQAAVGARENTTQTTKSPPPPLCSLHRHCAGSSRYMNHHLGTPPHTTLYPSTASNKQRQSFWKEYDITSFVATLLHCQHQCWKGTVSRPSLSHHAVVTHTFTATNSLGKERYHALCYHVMLPLIAEREHGAACHPRVTLEIAPRH